MATGSVYVDSFFKFPDGQILAAGRIKTGVTDVIRAPDLKMSHVNSILLTPWGPAVGSVGSVHFKIAEGSIGSLNSLGSLNYVRVRQFRLDSYRVPGTVRLGTFIGTSRLSYIAMGY